MSISIEQPEKKMWDDMKRIRERWDLIRWWDEKNLVFSHKFSFPLKCKNLLIVLGRNKEIKFAKEKIEMVVGFQKKTNIYLVIENIEHYQDLLSLEGEDKNGNIVEIISLSYPLSESILLAKKNGRLPSKVDCCIVLSPHYYYWDMNYLCILNLCTKLKPISENIFTLNNSNYLTNWNDPLGAVCKIKGIELYGFASLTDRDMRILYEYAGKSAGGVSVEIGRFLGGSTNIIARAIKDSGRPTSFYSFDPLLPEVVSMTLEKNSLQNYVNLFQKSSEDAFLNWHSISDSSEIDFLFVDGDHSFKGIYFDLSSWTTLVKKGGIIIVHDYCNIHFPSLEDVDVAINKVFINDRYEVLETCLASFVCKKIK